MIGDIESMSLLVVDIESKFGSFNNPSSNVGGLMTYLIPPKTTVQGLLGSILGLEFNDTVNVFKDFKYTVRPLFPLNKKNTTYNCHYGGRQGRMVNIQQEILINPKYRLFLHIPDKKPPEEILEILKRHFNYINSEELSKILEKIMSKKESYYNLYMGKNEFPLSYKLHENENWKKIKIETFKDRKFIINSAVPREIVEKYDINIDSEEKNLDDILSMTKSEKFRLYNIKKLPKCQTEDRNFQKFENVVLKQPKSKVTLKAELRDRVPSDYVLYRKEEEILACF